MKGIEQRMYDLCDLLSVDVCLDKCEGQESGVVYINDSNGDFILPNDVIIHCFTDPSEDKEICMALDCCCLVRRFTHCFPSNVNISFEQAMQLL